MDLLQYDIEDELVAEQLAERREQAYEIIDNYNLGWVLRWKSANHSIPPYVTYHDDSRMLEVMLRCHELYTESDTNQPLPGRYSRYYKSSNELELLLVAALIHDFKHSGGYKPDKENIAQVISEIVTHEDVFLKNLKHLKGVSTVDLLDLIRTVQYPFVREPYTFAQACLRDADILQSFAPNGVVMIMENLRKEMEIMWKEKISYERMYEGQKTFFSNAKLYTSEGKDIFYKGLPKLLQSLERYCKERSTNIKRAVNEPHAANKFETIEGVAIKHPDGTVYMKARPHRHHHVIQMMATIGKAGLQNTKPSYQGFYTSFGRFVDRKEACRLAIASGQVKEENVREELYSEDLWNNDGTNVLNSETCPCCREKDTEDYGRYKEWFSNMKTTENPLNTALNNASRSTIES